MSHSSPVGFRHKFFAILGLCFVLVMVALDQTVIGTALPTVVAELHGFDLYAWVGTSYLLTSVMTIPIFGKLGDEHGRKPFILVAIVIFTVASALCGLAESMLQLVWARTLQGIGGGMLVSTTFASVPDLFPVARDRLRWQVLFSSAFGLANVVGPSLGGYLAEYWGWRWVFFVNLPVGLLSLLFVWRYLPRIRHSEKPPERLDIMGSVLVALALSSFLLLLEWLPLHKSPVWLVAIGVTGTVSAALLVWWERRCPNPVLPLDMFSHHSLSPLLLLSLTMGFSMFAVMYYAPLMLQGGFGFSPNEAGLLITPLAVFITVGSIVNGRIVARLPSPNFMLFVGLACFAGGVVLLTQITAATPHKHIMGVMMLCGMGLGMLLPNVTLFVQASAPRTQLGVATAMLQSMRMVGGMLGMALGGTFISHLYLGGIMEAHNGRQWLNWLHDPQILVNHELADQFAVVAGKSGASAAALLEAARNSLVSAIHVSQWTVLLLLLLAVWLARRVPPINLHAHTVTGGKDEAYE